MDTWSSSELQQMVNAFHDTFMKWGMRINTDKTKILSIGAEEANISIAGRVLENVSEFCYLGSIVTKSGDCHLEVVERIQKASRTFCSWKCRVFTSRGFSKNTKLRVFRSLVMPVLLYGCETWAITQVDIRRLNTFHMRCIRSILGVSRLNKIRNSFNLKSAKEEPIECQIQHQRLQWLGYLQRMNVSRPQKLLLRSKLHNVKCPQHGPKNRWIDTIQRDLVSLNIDPSQANDRSSWRKLLQCRSP
ncbi:uncharacterized protein LOC134189273 [Corticium candelabrum]|uniref:uncharacterized protein LOC134189273 n=1 Tax=Corticium candelabrum TaxID=121492 RepID=UPI002E26059D|nr:uncharacterized protein LOC134189273 [Corticium candelabrum]